MKKKYIQVYLIQKYIKVSAFTSILYYKIQIYKYIYTHTHIYICIYTTWGIYKYIYIYTYIQKKLYRKYTLSIIYIYFIHTSDP